MTEYHNDTAPRGSGPGSAPDIATKVRCFVCHRVLRDPESVTRRCGPVCAERVGLRPETAAEPEGNITPLFPLPERRKRRLTVHTQMPWRRPRVTCDVCHRRRPSREIHPVSLEENETILAVCEPCIGAILRHGLDRVRTWMDQRSRRDAS